MHREMSYNWMVLHKIYININLYIKVTIYIHILVTRKIHERTYKSHIKKEII